MSINLVSILFKIVFCSKFLFLSFLKMQHLIDMVQTLVGEFFLPLRYHETCYVSVVNPKYFKPKLATNKDANTNDTSEEAVIEFLMEEILNNQDKIWNSVEIYDVYIRYGGHQHVPSNKNRLMNREYLNYYMPKCIYSSLSEVLHC